jgi:hypothetical protein
VALASSALAIFGAFYLVDYYLTSPPPAPTEHALWHYLDFDPDHITDATSSLAAMVAAVFGIVITVVSIIVQLSADRYTGVARNVPRRSDQPRGHGLLPDHHPVRDVAQPELKDDLRAPPLVRAMLVAWRRGPGADGPVFRLRVLVPRADVNIIGRIRLGAVRGRGRRGVRAGPGAPRPGSGGHLAAMEES